jgi:oxaloacetate decarboxylase beta subunit
MKRVVFIFLATVFVSICAINTAKAQNSAAPATCEVSLASQQTDSDTSIFERTIGSYHTGLTTITIWQIIMILLALVFVYLSVAKRYEPLLLLPLAFGILIANIPGAHLSAYDEGGLLQFLYQGILRVVYPPMIFLCIGAMTDFGPLIASPRNALIGLGGQLGIFVAFGGAVFLGDWLTFIPGFDGFSFGDAASIAIIGSSDGPTSIFAASRMAPDLLPTVAIAAFSYMALVPFIQPPIMRMLTTAKERVVVMPEPKKVTQRQKVVFPILMAIVTLLFVPAAGALIGMFMLGNLIRESGVTGRYLGTLQDHFLNILTLLVAVSIGASATAEHFLTPTTLIVIFLGLVAFTFGTVGGILVAKLLYKTSGGKVNPLIGNSGVSAMPMAARISQKLGQQYNPQNHLLMHAMGPIVSSTVGSAIVAGIFIALYGN